MAHARFYVNCGPLPLGEFLRLSGLAASAVGGDILDINAPESAQPGDIIFIESARYLPAVTASAASFVLAKPELAPDIQGKIIIPTPTPQLHFIAAIHALYPAARQPDLADAQPISPRATIAPDARIEHGAVIGAGAEIGAGTVIGAGSVIGPGVVIGKNCVIAPHVTITHTLMGDGVAVLAGARIGQDGFGFVTHNGQHIRMPQMGIVRIGDNSEIGANATVDRGALADTVIGRNVIIDNQVQVAHNVVVGDGAILVSQSGVAGSSRIGRYAVLAAQAGVADHLEIGDFAQIGAQAGVMRDVEPKARMMGSPAQPAREFFRQVSQLAKSSKSVKT